MPWSPTLTNTATWITNMNDREILELAAKAAGFGIDDWNGDTPVEYFWDGDPENPERNYRYWNPLIDDGDALRLAVACGLVVDCSRPSAGEPYKQHAIWLDETMSNAELTRRAIVRAAAEIGRNMK